MAILQRMTIAFLTVAMLATGAVRAASTTNFSDNWYTEGQAGWGMFVQQQTDVLFIGLFVYGADNKPTWFTATAVYQSNSVAGHVVFTGDLYLTNGTYYGATWNPAALGYTKVGTLTFDATTTNEATLTYTVDGMPVVKNVTRLLLRYENLSGKYSGGWNSDKSGCINAPLNAPPVHDEDPLTITIDHAADNAVMMVLQFADGSSIALRGTYSQSGRMGRIVGEFDQSYSTWSYGSIDMVEIETTISSFTARFSGDLIMARWRDHCFMTNGRIGGVRR